MLVSQTVILDVPLAEGTIVTIPDVSPYQRTFYFRNLTSSVLTITIQESADGGATWIDYAAAFTVGIFGGGADVVVKNVVSTGILRLRASGGGNDRDLYLGLTRFYLATGLVLPLMTL